jgi:hypothetical protein
LTPNELRRDKIFSVTKAKQRRSRGESTKIPQFLTGFTAFMQKTIALRQMPHAACRRTWPIAAGMLDESDDRAGQFRSRAAKFEPATRD